MFGAGANILELLNLLANAVCVHIVATQWLKTINLFHYHLPSLAMMTLGRKIPLDNIFHCEDMSYLMRDSIVCERLNVSLEKFKVQIDNAVIEWLDIASDFTFFEKLHTIERHIDFQFKRANL